MDGATGLPPATTVLVPPGQLHTVRRSDRGANLASLRGVARRSIAGVDSNSFGTWDRVVVTGGSGCVGTAVLRLLRRLGVSQVISIAHMGPLAHREVPGAEYLYGDITDRRQMEKLLTDIRPDLVVHLAGIRDPGLAERQVVAAVTVNVVGTEIVLSAAAHAGVPVAVAASTGKAMRLFTSDIYASSKQLLEYQVSVAAQSSTMRTGCARFTHIVDNSLIYDKMARWARADQPVRLHGPNVDLFVQSAREAAELLMVTARVAATDPSPSRVNAINDLGWPPIDLFGLAMDVVEETGSASSIVSVGFPPGYEEVPYPGTTDPRTAGDHSPLFNALEADRAYRPRGCVDAVGSTVLQVRDDSVDRDLVALEASLSSRSAAVVRDQLRVTCLDYLELRLSGAPPQSVASMALRGARRPLISQDHAIAHELVTAHLQDRLPAEPESSGLAALTAIV